MSTESRMLVTGVGARPRQPARTAPHMEAGLGLDAIPDGAMTVHTLTPPRARKPRMLGRAIAPWVSIAALSCLTIYVWQGLGWLSLPGLAFAAVLGCGLALAIALYAPAALVVLAPAL